MKAKNATRIQKIVRALKPYDPERVILFGSAARGDADKFSDIDLVIIKETSERFLDRIGRVYDCLKPDYALDAWVYTPREFADLQARENPFIEQVLAEGIVVYERARGGVQPIIARQRGGNGMRKAEAEQEGRRWLEQAQSDLDVAKWNEQGGFHSAACFWAQQTGERALKAFLYFHGKRRVIGHSVLELANESGRFDSEFKKLIDTASALDRFYIPTRYPNGLPGGVPSKVFSVTEAKHALELAEKIVGLVAGKIPPESETR